MQKILKNIKYIVLAIIVIVGFSSNLPKAQAAFVSAGSDSIPYSVNKVPPSCTNKILDKSIGETKVDYGGQCGPTVSLFASPTQVNKSGDTTTLTWSPTNSTSCTAGGGGWSGSKSSADGTYTQTSSPITADTIFNITCSGPKGPDAFSTVTVTVKPVVLAPVVTITASPTSGTVNVVNPTITWSTTNTPTSCTATNNWTTATAPGTKPVSGSQSQGVLNTVKTYTYTLACTNSAGTDTKSATVTVNPGSCANGANNYSACNACTPPSVFDSNTNQCINNTTHNVTSSAQSNGTISPSGISSVNDGATKSFTLSPNSNYTSSISGTCPAGTLTGNSYITGSIKADCTVIASFTASSIPSCGTTQNTCVNSSYNGDGSQQTTTPPYTYFWTCTGSKTISCNPQFPQCSNGIDDDGDGLIDYGTDPKVNDPGCKNATDNTEKNIKTTVIEQ